MSCLDLSSVEVVEQVKRTKMKTTNPPVVDQQLASLYGSGVASDSFPLDSVFTTPHQEWANMVQLRFIKLATQESHGGCRASRVEQSQTLVLSEDDSGYVQQVRQGGETHAFPA